MKGSEFVFDSVHSLFCKCHKITHKLWWSIYRFSWLDKKHKINPINKKDDKCFQYAVSVALNNEEIKKNSQRPAKIKLFINKYNWEGINFPSEKDDCKKLRKTM